MCENGAIIAKKFLDKFFKINKIDITYYNFKSYLLHIFSFVMNERFIFVYTIKLSPLASIHNLCDNMDTSTKIL